MYRNLIKKIISRKKLFKKKIRLQVISFTIFFDDETKLYKNFVERLDLRKYGFFVEHALPAVLLTLGFRNSWSSYSDLNRKKIQDFEQ